MCCCEGGAGAGHPPPPAPREDRRLPISLVHFACRSLGGHGPPPTRGAPCHRLTKGPPRIFFDRRGRTWGSAPLGVSPPPPVHQGTDAPRLQLDVTSALRSPPSGGGAPLAGTSRPSLLACFLLRKYLPRPPGGGLVGPHRASHLGDRLVPRFTKGRFAKGRFATGRFASRLSPLASRLSFSRRRRCPPHSVPPSTHSPTTSQH